MMLNRTEHLLDWLRNAHALEQQVEALLHSQSDQLEYYADLKLRLQNHLNATIRNHDAINHCIEHLCEERPTASVY